MTICWTCSAGRTVVVFVFLASLRAYAAPAQASSPSTPAAAPVFKDFRDDAGRTVRIPQPVQRIVSLAPSLTETIYALGLQERLVGDTDYCDYPPDAQKKPKVGGTMNPSIEQIVALRPDLVLVTRGPNRIETVNALSDLGIPSYAMDPHTVQQIISSTKRLADALGASDAGAAVGTDLERRLADLRQRLGGLTPSRVLFVVWPDPLISVGQNTFIADALRHAGATSIVESSQDWPEMSLEEVVRLQPDYLVFAASHSGTAQNDFAILAERPGWRGLDAVRTRHVAVISEAVNRPAPRIVSAIEELARQLHPQAFVTHPDARDKKTSLLPLPLTSLHAAPAPWEACACAARPSAV